MDHDLIQSNQQDLIVSPVERSQYGDKTTAYLSALSQATKATFRELSLPTGIENNIDSPEIEKQVREAFAAEDLLEKLGVIDELALDRIIAGADPSEVEAILGGTPEAQSVEEVGPSIMERKAAQFLVDQGLLNDERAAVIINEEFSPEGLEKASKTTGRQDFLTTLNRMNTIGVRLAEKYKEQSFSQATLDFLSIALVPGLATTTAAKVFGRDLDERLGTSIKKFSDNFWASSLDDRMKVLDQFEKDLNENTLVGQNVLQAMQQLEQLLSFTDEDRLGIDTLEALDASIIGGTVAALFRGLKSISAAARFAGAKDVPAARALVLRKKQKEGGALTVVEEDELIENTIPSSATIHIGPEKSVGPASQAMEMVDMSEQFTAVLPTLFKELKKAGVDVDLDALSPVDLLALVRRTIVPEVLAEGEQGAANLAAMKAILRRFGVKTEVRDLVDPETFTGGSISTKVYPVFDVDRDPVSGIRTVNVFLGTGEGLTKGFTSTAAAEAGAERMGIAKGFFEVSERTGEFFIKVSRNPGTTQYISPIDPSEIPRTMPGISKAFAGKATTSTLDDLKGARLSESAETLLMQALVKAMKAINPRTTPTGPGLSPSAKKVFDELMMDVHQNEKWMTGGQVVEWYQKHHQRRPNEREMKAYAASKEIYAFNFFIHNNRLKGELVGQGYQEGMVTGLFKSPVVLREVATTGLEPRQVRIFDGVEKKLVNVRDREDLNLLLRRSEDMVLVKFLTRSKKFGDYAIVSRQDLNIRPLRAQVLNKIDGPNRIYDGDTFIKQSKVRIIGGQATMVNPKTHFVVKGASEGKKFADAYNEALNAFRTAEISGSAMDKAFATDIISKNTIFSSYEEMLKAIEAGQMERTPFEALKSGEFPTFREEGVKIMAVDTELASFSDEVQVLIQNGRLFYSKRGPRLKHPDGSLAPLIHPDKILAKTSRSAVGTQAYNNYKIRQTERWVKTNEKYLVPTPGWGTAKKFLYGQFDLSANAPVPITAETLRNANLQRAGIKRLLKNRGVLEQTVERYRDQIIDIIDNRFNSDLADRGADIMSGNPMISLRGMAFKAFLGFGDISQIIVQTSMTPGVIAIAPIEGAVSLSLYPAIRAALLNPKTTDFISKIVDKSKIMSGENFKTMMEDLETSGVSIIGRNLGDVDTMSNSGNVLTMGGALLSRSTDSAMLFFNEAEKFVRTLGFTIAWQEFFKLNGIRPTSVDHMASVMVRGIALAGNMTRAEKAWWQEGTLGLATQFVAQPFRLAELMFLDTLGGFKGKDKLRWYTGLALAYGPTLGLRGDQSAPGSASEYIKQKYFEENGTEIDETLLRFMTDGIVGMLLPDTDISRLQPFGQGTLLSEFFDTEKGLDIWNMLGASGSMLSRFYNATIGSAKLWAFISSDIDIDLVPLTLVDIANDVGKTLVSYNRIQKAIHAYQNLEYVSNKGDLLQRDIDTFDAAMIGLGFPPMKSSAAFESLLFLKDYKDKVRLDAKQAAVFFNRAMAAPEGSRVERMNLSYMNYIRSLHTRTNISGMGAANYAIALDAELARTNALTEEVRMRMNRVLGRDPLNLR